MQYAGFWRRLGAHILDAIILFPISALAIWGSTQSRLFNLYFFLPSFLFSLWFFVYLVKHYGGTPGKLLLNMRITKVDGSAAGYKEAVLRHLVLFLLSTLVSIALNTVALGMTDAEYFSMSWLERSTHMVEHAPAWYKPVNIAMQIWMWSEFITMLTNKKRRAIHDFMAGTVVIENRRQ